MLTLTDGLLHYILQGYDKESLYGATEYHSSLFNRVVELAYSESHGHSLSSALSSAGYISWPQVEHSAFFLSMR